MTLAATEQRAGAVDPLGGAVLGPLRAPFPYFGGKHAVAPLVWAALGDVYAYVEPFAGSAAVLLARPAWHRGRVETINDADCFVANFWRAMTKKPEAVAAAADWPINEADLHARHRWLLDSAEAQAWRERMHADPNAYDVQIAGWWVWGQSTAILGNWLASGGANARPHIRAAGVHAEDGLARVRDLAARLRSVRVLCGDWSGMVSSDSMLSLPWGKPAGVFFDPPYSAAANRDAACYRVDCLRVADDVRAWCRERGADLRVRIVLAGYEGEHEDLEAVGWSVVAWRTQGGMANRADGQGRVNAGRERLWLSPHCLRADAHARQERLPW